VTADPVGVAVAHAGSALTGLLEAALVAR